METELVSSRKLYSEEFCLVSSKPLRLKDIPNERWIYGNNAEMLKRVSRQVSERYIRVNSVPTIIKLVEQGYGVAVLPKHLVPKDSKLLVQDLPRVKKGAVYLATANYQIVPETIRRFLAYF